MCSLSSMAVICPYCLAPTCSLFYSGVSSVCFPDPQLWAFLLLCSCVFSLMYEAFNWEFMILEFYLCKSFEPCFKMYYIKHDAFHSVKHLGTKSSAMPSIITGPGILIFYRWSEYRPRKLHSWELPERFSLTQPLFSQPYVSRLQWVKWGEILTFTLFCYLISPLYDREWLKPSFFHTGPMLCLHSPKTGELNTQICTSAQNSFRRRVLPVCMLSCGGHSPHPMHFSIVLCLITWECCLYVSYGLW